MALIVEKELPNGTSVSYWVVGGFTYAKSNPQKIKCTIEGYISEDARKAEKKPAVSGFFSVEGNVDYSQSVIQQIYSALKKEPMFIKATQDEDGPFVDTNLVVVKEVKDKDGTPKPKFK
jgi:hypothetical protein